MNHRTVSALGILAMLVFPIASNSAEHLGSAVSAKNADRTVVLKPNVESVNIERGEIVTLVYMDKSFTWKFDTLGFPTFRLAEVAPKDFGIGHVRIAVFPHRLLDAGG